MAFGKKDNKKEAKDLVYLVSLASSMYGTIHESLDRALIKSDVQVVEAHLIDLLKQTAGSQDQVIEGSVFDV